MDSIFQPIIIIVGPGAAGKDFLRRKLQLKGFRYSVSYASRERRPEEIIDEDYHFVSKEFFEDTLTNNPDFWLETTFYGGHYYGTPREHMDTCNLFVMNLDGLRSLDQKTRARCFVMYLNPDPSVLHERLAQRGWDNDRINARRELDIESFKDFIDYDMIVTNAPF
jgi:guanylate kinase